MPSCSALITSGAITCHREHRCVIVNIGRDAGNVICMADPVTLALAVAAAVVGKVAETLTEKGQEAVAEMARKIRERLKPRPEDAAVLDLAVAGTAEAPALARVLDREFAADPEFRAEIEALWRQAGTVNGPAANVTNATNVFTGTAEKVIQIGGDVGDLTID